MQLGHFLRSNRFRIPLDTSNSFALASAVQPKAVNVHG
jgi:hypothetical protein